MELAGAAPAGDPDADADALFDAAGDFLDAPERRRAEPDPQRRKLVRPPPPRSPRPTPQPSPKRVKLVRRNNFAPLDPLDPLAPDAPPDDTTNSERSPSPVRPRPDAGGPAAADAPPDRSNDVLDVRKPPSEARRNGPPAEVLGSEGDKSASASEPSDAESEPAEPALPRTVPKLTIRPLPPAEPKPPFQPPIEKMTIKIGKPPEAERADPPETAVPRMLIKLDDERSFSVAKNCDGENESALRMTIKLGRRDGSPSPRSVPKLTIKIPQEFPAESAPIERRDSDAAASASGSDGDAPPAPDATPDDDEEDEDDEDAEDDPPPVPRVTIRAVPVPDGTLRPLEIETGPFRCAHEQESGQESPRIILKINKTGQGPTSEILTEKSQQRRATPAADADPDAGAANGTEQVVPKLTIKIQQEEVGTDCAPDADASRSSPVGRITLKLSKDGGGRAKIVGRATEDASDPIVESPKTTRRPAREDAAPKRPPSVDRAAEPEPKRPKFAEAETSDPATPPRDVPAAVGGRRGGRGSRVAAPKIDVDRAPEAAERPASARGGRRTAAKRSERISNYNRERAAALEADSGAADRPADESPVFDEVDGDALVADDGSSSRDCAIVDDLSQDPLDIESAAKAHFAAERASSPTADGLADVVVQPATDTTPKQKRGRGRPRKVPVEKDPGAAAAAAPQIEERNLRNARTPRDNAATKTPRGRGRGRGSRRGSLLVATNHTVEHETTNENSVFFSGLSNVERDAKESDVGSDGSGRLSESPGRRGDGSRRDESDAPTADSDLSAPEPTSPNEWSLLDGFTPRGRGRGRGSRGPRRNRGGRTPRSCRGSRTNRGGRGKRFEEVQLQDAVPLNEIKDGIKTKVESVHVSSLQLFEEETCMMGDNETPLRNAALIDEESQSSEVSGITTESGKCKKSRLMEIFDEGNKVWSAADVAEYDWPPEGFGPESPPQTFMIQEQVALYLGVKSFKRKYPDLNRRPLDPDEKNFLRDRGLISEAMCDLGVTAVDAGEVLDIMFTDFPSKYEEYRQHLRETRDTRAANRPPPQLSTERSKQETMERAVQSASSWNARFNRQRRTMRSAAMDLQTLTLHRPRRPQTVAPYPTTISHYPVALLPGQYTDFYRSYTPEELRYFPLNTVLNIMQSPSRIEEGADSPSEESAEDSDAADSSSDGSDSESSERNFKRKNLNPKSTKSRATTNDGNFSKSSRPPSPSGISGQSQPIPSPLPPPPPVEVPRCKLCSGTEHANRRYPTETFITCASCQKKVHPSCLEMAPSVAKCVRLYAWQCADCKCCARCEDLADDDKMLFCDLCDRGYHIYCVGLKKVPTGRWHCSHCAICRSCGARSPTGPPGAPSPLQSSTHEQWHHHLKKGSSGQKVYSHTLCGPCARAWRAGRYCSLCERCFMGKKGALKVVICVNCDRTHHKECVRQPGRTLDVLNYMCNGCRRGNTPRRHIMPRKYRGRRTSQPSTNNTNDSAQGPNQNNNNTREAITSMDLSVDSICTNDSNHQAISVCDGTFEESNSSIKVLNKKKSPSKELYGSAASKMNKKLNLEFDEKNSNTNSKVSSNHLGNIIEDENLKKKVSSNSLKEKSNDIALVKGTKVAADSINMNRKIHRDSSINLQNKLNISHSDELLNRTIGKKLSVTSTSLSDNIESYSIERKKPIKTDNNSKPESIILSKLKDTPMEVDVQYKNDTSENSSFIEKSISDSQGNKNPSEVK